MELGGTGEKPRDWIEVRAAVRGLDCVSQNCNYGSAKKFGQFATVNCRDSYGLFACGGIPLNLESPRRGETFATRKISRAGAAIKLGLRNNLYLGNMDAKRNWGYAPEYMEEMWRMLQADQPDDYMLATNETHTVQDFVEEASGHVRLDSEKYVKCAARYKRSAEVDLLIDDPAKAKKQLGWESKIRFKELVQIMVDADVASLQGLPVPEPLAPEYHLGKKQA